MSRELDAEVAEKVMGLKVAHPSPLRFVQMGHTIHPNNVPRFSTDIAAAWMVVEKMSERDWVFDFVYYPQTNGTLRARADFWFATDYEQTYEVLDTSLP